MKAERRHELKENDLVHAVRVTRDYIQEHSGRIGLLIVVVVAIIAVSTITVRSRAATAEAAWHRKNTLDFATAEAGKASLKTLSDLTREATDPRFILTSLIDQGAVALSLARKVDDPPDRELNELAREAFERLLAEFGDNPLAVGTARVGLATVAENAFLLDERSEHRVAAREQLTAIINDPTLDALPFHRMAADRLKSLKQTFTVVQFAPPRALPTGEPLQPTKFVPIPTEDEGESAPPVEQKSPDEPESPETP